MAKPFPLLGLLRLRGLQDDMATVAMSRANQRLSAIERRQRTARIDIEQSPAEFTSAMAVRLAALARVSARAALGELDVLEQDALIEHQSATRNFSTARRQLHAVEKLHEKHIGEATAQDLREEQTFLDEVASAARKERA